MRCAIVLLLIERSATLMPTPPASMPSRSSGVKRAAPEPTAECEPTELQPAAAPEPEFRPTSYDNKYNWTTSAQAPMGATTAQNRLAALKAAAENDESIIRVRWSDPRTIAGLCVFIPLLGAGVLLSLVFMTCAEGSSAPSTRRRRESGSRLGRRRLFFDEFLAISRGFICASRNIELADLCPAVGVG